MSAREKPSIQPKPWLCPRCGTIVYVIQDHHAYLCHQYRKGRDTKTPIESGKSHGTVQ